MIEGFKSNYEQYFFILIKGELILIITYDSNLLSFPRKCGLNGN
jgi:hypothetical protein